MNFYMGTKYVLGIPLEYSRALLRIFPLEIFQKLRIGTKVLRDFAHCFELGHVFKRTYMENICHLSFPKLSQIFLR